MECETSGQAGAALEIMQRYLAPPTGKQRLLTYLLHSTDNRFQPLCENITRLECMHARQHQHLVGAACTKLHFRPILFSHTNAALGHCGYLSSCHRIGTCKYVHYELDTSPPHEPFVWECRSHEPYAMRSPYAHNVAHIEPTRALQRCGLDAWLRTAHWDVAHVPQAPLVAQWIDCDVRSFDLASLGKFDVILADPPWDIHMSLPYGTLSDEDMYALQIPALQDEGLLFLWVTGRAMELGRQLFKKWGYTRIDELVWIKTNQMERLVRTGRTGHWLNHTKEHCLVGFRGRKQHALRYRYAAGQTPLRHAWMNAGVSTNVLVSQVRETSRKPDELYAMIERICPGGRKMELFGRQHNIRPGWLTLGNQLKTTHVVEPVLYRAVEAAHHTTT